MTRLKLAGSETFASLRIRNFRLFFSGQVISQSGTWLGMVAQTLLVLKLTDSGVALGLLTAVQFLPMLLLGAWAGVVADRSDKRKLLITLQSLAMLQSFVMAGLAFWGSPPLLAIYGAAFAGGILTAFDNPVRRSFVVEMVPESHVTNAVSLNSALMTGARVVGPAIAGLLVTTVGFGWTFLLDGLSYIAVLIGLTMIRPSELRAAPLVEKAKGQVRDGLRYAASLPQLWMPLAMTAVIGALAFNFQVVMPLFATESLGGTDRTFTWLFSVLSIGSLVGALAVARRTTSSVHRVGVAAIVFGITMAMMAVAPNQLTAFLIGPLIGMASITFMTSSTALVQTEAAPIMRGRVLALQAMVFIGSTPVGGPIVGLVAQRFGPRWAIALGAVACLVAGTWGVRRARRHEVDTQMVTAGPEAVVIADPEVEPEPETERVPAGLVSTCR